MQRRGFLMKTKSKRIILSLTTLVLNLSVFTTISSAQVTTSQPLSINENFVENKTQDSTIETNYPAFTVPRGFKCRNNREINDIHTNLITSIYCSKPSSITSPVESKRTELRALR